MGFDNDCILNIQSVAPEYFCPVCRTLVYPTEALQTQCSHLYCKPCLVHIASGAQTCPYDGNLVTEAGAKPVSVINRTLADAIGKVAVRCLYHRSGCMWQGPLSECIVHRSGCAFGDSQVLCMKCQVQIAHRQAEEHAQICNINVMNPEVQPGPMNPQITPADNLNQPAMANPQPQALPATVMSTSPWYQPQYQQVYAQMYPYSLEATQPFNQAPSQVQGLPPSQAHAQLQPQSQVVVQAQPQFSFPGQQGPPLYPQPVMPRPNGTQAQLNSHVQNQPTSLHHVQNHPTSLPHVQIQRHNQLLSHGHMPPQLSSQAPPQAVQGHSQQHMQVPQFQQSLSQVHHPQPSLRHPGPQSQSQPIDYLRPLEPPQRLPSRGQAPGIPSVQQHTNPHSQVGLPVQQHPVTCQVQQPWPQQYVQQPQISAGCTSGPLQGQLHHVGPFADQALGRTTKVQDYKPQSMKNSGMDANSNEKKHGADASNEHKPENEGGDGYGKNEAVIKDAVIELQEGQRVSCYPVATQRFGGGMNNNFDYFPGGNLVQNKAVDVGDCFIYSVKPVEVNMNVQPSTHFKIAEHGRFPNPGQVSNVAENFHPPAPNQSGSFYPRGWPGSQSSYTHQGFPNAGLHCSDGSDSFDNSRKRKSWSMNWCRICNVDCESVQGLEMHGQTREHHQMAMNMVNNIKQKSARISMTSNAHSGFGEASKLGSAWSHGCGSKP